MFKSFIEDKATAYNRKLSYRKYRAKARKNKTSTPSKTFLSLKQAESLANAIEEREFNNTRA